MRELLRLIGTTARTTRLGDIALWAGGLRLPSPNHHRSKGSLFRPANDDLKDPGGHRGDRSTMGSITSSRIRIGFVS